MKQLIEQLIKKCKEIPCETCIACKGYNPRTTAYECFINEPYKFKISEEIKYKMENRRNDE